MGAGLEEDVAVVVEMLVHKHLRIAPVPQGRNRPRLAVGELLLHLRFRGQANVLGAEQFGDAVKVDVPAGGQDQLDGSAIGDDDHYLGYSVAAHVLTLGHGLRRVRLGVMPFFKGDAPLLQLVANPGCCCRHGYPPKWLRTGCVCAYDWGSLYIVYCNDTVSVASSYANRSPKRAQRMKVLNNFSKFSCGMFMTSVSSTNSRSISCRGWRCSSS